MKRNHTRRHNKEPPPSPDDIASSRDIYYSLTHLFKWKLYRLEIYKGQHYLVLNFYQINEDDEIRSRNCLVIENLIPYLKTNSTQKIKLLNKFLRYNLYYFLTHPLKWKLFELEIYKDPYYLALTFYQINQDNKI